MRGSSTARAARPPDPARYVSLQNPGVHSRSPSSASPTAPASFPTRHPHFPSVSLCINVHINNLKNHESRRQSQASQPRSALKALRHLAPGLTEPLRFVPTASSTPATRASPWPWPHTAGTSHLSAHHLLLVSACGPRPPPLPASLPDLLSSRPCPPCPLQRPCLQSELHSQLHCSSHLTS